MLSSQPDAAQKHVHLSYTHFMFYSGMKGMSITAMFPKDSYLVMHNLASCSATWQTYKVPSWPYQNHHFCALLTVWGCTAWVGDPGGQLQIGLLGQVTGHLVTPFQHGAQKPNLTHTQFLSVLLSELRQNCTGLRWKCTHYFCL